MALTIILVIAVLMLFSYINGQQKLKEKNLRVGGMKEKYSLLYQYFIAQFTLSVLTETKMVFSKTIDNHWIKWTVKQHYSNYATIEWETNSDGFYKKYLQWQFKDYAEQEKIISEINHAMIKNFKD